MDPLFLELLTSMVQGKGFTDSAEDEQNRKALISSLGTGELQFRLDWEPLVGRTYNDQLDDILIKRGIETEKYSNLAMQCGYGLLDLLEVYREQVITSHQAIGILLLSEVENISGPECKLASQRIETPYADALEFALPKFNEKLIIEPNIGLCSNYKQLTLNLRRIIFEKALFYQASEKVAPLSDRDKFLIFNEHINWMLTLPEYKLYLEKLYYKKYYEIYGITLQKRAEEPLELNNRELEIKTVYQDALRIINRISNLYVSHIYMAYPAIRSLENQDILQGYITGAEHLGDISCFIAILEGIKLLSESINNSEMVTTAQDEITRAKYTLVNAKNGNLEIPSQYQILIPT